MSIRPGPLFTRLRPLVFPLLGLAAAVAEVLFFVRRLRQAWRGR